MKRNKVIKGQYGYINKQRTRIIIRTILMFALSLAVFGIGLWSTGGDKKNLLTVVAILGCLPASKSAVSVVMFLRVKGCSETVYKKVQEHSDGLTSLYDLVFTSYEKNYQISHIVINENLVCGYSEDEKCDSRAGEKHIETLLKQGGCKNVTVKIYKDLEKYCEGLDNLCKQQAEENTAEQAEQLEEIIINLSAIAL